MIKLKEYQEKLLSEFEGRIDNWTYRDFDNRLKELQEDISLFEETKIIAMAYDSGLYPNTVRRYILTAKKELEKLN